jgi:diguanylate cyclase
MALLLEDKCKSGSSVVRILHLEDSEPDRELTKLLLNDAGIECEITEVQTRAEFVSSLGQGVWDLIISDFTLPAFDGLEALAIATKVCPSTPFIFVTGTMGEDIAVETLKNGATDYVLKQKISRLDSAVRRALNARAERLRREKAELELVENEEKLNFMAYHDVLTSLPNRALFQDRLECALFGARRQSEKAGIFFIDLDNFKTINDSLGHAAGDTVLKHVAERMRSCVRDNDTVARLGGDEFVVVATGIKDSTDAVIAADRISRVIATETLVEGIPISISCSIGISIFPDDGEDGETLLKNADVALFQAKKDGKNGWQFFTPEMNGQALHRLTLESGLRSALAKEQLFLEYQPQMDIHTGRIVGVEALCRWNHPELGLISPSTFIPIAESTGEIVHIGEWVLRTACAQARLWQEAGITPLVMAVNVSAVQFHHESFLRIVQSALEDSHLAPRGLELEVTEGVLLSHADAMKSLLLKLRQIGVHVAIDDFGTGYCGLSYLRSFQFSRLKIDQSFVQSVSVDRQDATLTAAIISMGKILKMKVIAECVESREQLDFLESRGCNQIQGNYVSRPLAPDAFVELARSYQTSRPGWVGIRPQRGQFPAFELRNVV